MVVPNTIEIPSTPGSGSLAIGDPVGGGTPNCILYIDAAGNLAQDPNHFEYDSTTKTVSIFGTTHEQLVIGDSAALAVTLRMQDKADAWDAHLTIAPNFAFQNAPWVEWHLTGSDFNFAMDPADNVNGFGVPNVCISGPPAGGFWDEHSGPGLNWKNVAESADNKLWAIGLNAKQLVGYILNDANNNFSVWLEVTRNGIDNVAVNINASTVLITTDNFLLTRQDDNTKQVDFYVDANGDLHVLNLTANRFLNFDSPIKINNGIAASATFENALSLQWKDNGGTIRGVLNLFSDDNLYLDNVAGGDIVMRADPTPGHTTEVLRIKADGSLVFNAKDGGIRINNQTNGAGGSTGTLGNAPHAGDPDFWLPVNIAGVPGWMPWWHA